MIDPSRVKRMAAKDTPEPEPGALDEAVALDGREGVLRARRIEATHGRFVWRDVALIPAHEADAESSREALTRRLGRDERPGLIWRAIQARRRVVVVRVRMMGAHDVGELEVKETE